MAMPLMTKLRSGSLSRSSPAWEQHAGVRSILVGSDGAAGYAAMQQGFAGSDDQPAKKLFQFSVASGKESCRYAAKLDVVDTNDLLENRPSALTERPRFTACVSSRCDLQLAFGVTVKLIIAGA